MKKLILALLILSACTKQEPINPTETIGDFRSDTTYKDCQMIIFTSWNTYKNGKVFQSFDAKKVIGEPCVKTKRHEIYN